MAEINWNLARTDPIGEQARAYSYAEKVRQSAMQAQAGQQYAAGDSAAAAKTLAMGGDIQGATALEDRGQQQQDRQQKSAEAAYQYIGQALPVFEAIAEKHATDPDGGAQALAQAFDQIAPEIEQVTGHNSQALQQFRQNLITDAKGTIARVRGMLPVKYITVGRSVLRQQGGVMDEKPVYEGQRDAPAGYEYGPDGKTLQPLTGGPADPAVVKKLGETRREIVISNPIPDNGRAQAREDRQDARLAIQYRSQFNNEKDVKDFNDVANSYEIISDLAKRPGTAQDDIAAIFAFMKTLDPGSVVREGEFATAQNAAGIPDRIQNLYNNALKGTRLNPQQRKELANTVGQVYRSRQRRYKQLVTQYKGYLRDSNLSEDAIQERLPAGGSGDAKTDDLLKKYGL